MHLDHLNYFLKVKVMPSDSFLNDAFPLCPTGKGNRNQPQCSCLENSMDRGAWQAAVSGPTRSRTQLKQLRMLYVQFH